MRAFTVAKNEPLANCRGYKKSPKNCLHKTFILYQCTFEDEVSLQEGNQKQIFCLSEKKTRFSNLFTKTLVSDWDTDAGPLFT